MKLDKSDALLLHSVLFAYVNSNVSLEFVDINHLEDLFGRLHDFVSGEETDTTGSLPDDSEEDYDEEEDDSDVEEEEDDEDEEVEEEPTVDQYVTCLSASELSPINVYAPDGSKVSLEFEDVGDSDSVDALLDDGGVIIDSVTCVVLTNQNIALYDRESWHDFKVKKTPKSWCRVFPHGKTIGFTGGEEE